uniref:Uncharacterized protein n=1 Tax=Cacopsylla melanoneura TaxID=428564 RepID=A0A8D8YZ82_9HEMI
MKKMFELKSDLSTILDPKSNLSTILANQRTPHFSSNFATFAIMQNVKVLQENDLEYLDQCNQYCFRENYFKNIPATSYGLILNYPIFLSLSYQFYIPCLNDTKNGRYF